MRNWGGNLAAEARPWGAVISRFGAYRSASGVEPELVLDYENEKYSLDGRTNTTFAAAHTFTRASSATRRNASGTIETVGNDVARLDHDKNGNALGLLIEEQRTNELAYSEQFDNAAWVQTNTPTITANSTAAPDGATTADTVADTSTTAWQLIHQVAASFTGGGTYAGSCFVKKDATGRATRFPVFRVAYQGGTANNYDIKLDTSTGEFSLVAGGTGAGAATGGVEDWGDYWRVWVAGPDNGANTSAQFEIYPAGGADAAWTTANTANGSVIVWGAQLEAGALPTSYIPTTTAAVTRAADICSVATANFNFNASAGSLVAHAISPGASGAQTVWHLDDGTANERLRLFRDSANNPTFAVVDGGTGQASIDAGAWANATEQKSAAAWAANDFAISVDGAAVVTDAAGTLPAVTTLRVGMNHTPAERLNGHIPRLVYYPSRLSNADLVSAST